MTALRPLAVQPQLQLLSGSSLTDQQKMAIKEEIGLIKLIYELGLEPDDERAFGIKIK